MSTWKHFEVTAVDDQTVVANATQEVLLDNEVVDRFRLELLSIMSEMSPTNLVVDLSCVSRGSTAVINNLLLAKKKMLGSGGDLHLCALQAAMRHTFRILNLEDTVFKVFETQAEALKELGTSHA